MVLPRTAGSASTVSGASLYQRLLGPDFDRMPGALRRFHGSRDGATGAGVADVQIGSRPWIRLLSRALRFPPQGTGVPVTVRVQPDHDREIWDRTFGSDRMRSVQWLERGRLMERVGILTFTFDVSADDTGMRFRFVKLAAFGIPVPRRLALHVDADVTGSDSGWQVAVVVRTPGSRFLTSYDGHIVPALPA